MSLSLPVKALKAAAGSFTVALALTFVGFEAFLDYCPSKDLQFLGPNQLKDRPPVLNKLGHYEEDHPSRPTIALIGSSLAQYGSTLCDYGHFHDLDLDKDFAGYKQFRYLDQAISKAGGRPLGSIETANLSNSGTMLSEDFLILKEVCAKKNPPRAVVLELGPRDFIDNMTPEPYRSRLSQVLAKHQEPFTWRFNRSTTENLDITAEKLSLFYSMRGELHDCLVKIACDTFHRPASIYQATLLAKLAPPPCPAPDAAAGSGESPAKNKPASGNSHGKIRFNHIDDAVGSQAMIDFSAHEYEGRYVPLNLKKFDVEVGCLKQIVAYCQAKKLPLIVVNMPLSKRNLDILPADFKDKYQAMLKEVCTPKSGDTSLTYIDLRNDGRFVISDFRDTAHMRSTGGTKLADLLAPVIAEKLWPGQVCKELPDAKAGNARFASRSSNLN